MDFPKPVAGTEPSAPKPEQASVQPAQPTAVAEQPPAAEKKPEPAPASAPPPAPAPAPKPRHFKIQFSSIPSATLTVDGRRIGPSIPAISLDLTEGKHRMKLEAPGMPAYEKDFQVGPNTETRHNYRFPVGFLVIQAPEWAGASVLIDSKFKGVLGGESRFQLPSGDHRVTLSREGVDPVTASVWVPEGDKQIWKPPAPALHAASPR
jgi:hypothetical protein